jgi:hypothetical protein
VQKGADYCYVQLPNLMPASILEGFSTIQKLPSLTVHVLESHGLPKLKPWSREGKLSHDPNLILTVNTTQVDEVRKNTELKHNQ